MLCRRWLRALAAVSASLLASVLRGQTITEFPVPTPGSGPSGVTSGPDGNVWFTEANAGKVGRITPGGVFLPEFPTPGGALAITAGPDGNLWFTEPFAAIGRITTAGVVTDFPLESMLNPADITAGPDGNLWYTAYDLDHVSRVGRITTAGVITEFNTPTASDPVGIAAGPDGNLWFAESFAGQIGRITTSGVITEFPVPTSSGSPFGIAAGSDGNLWFTEALGNKIGRITTAGVVTEFPIPTASSMPLGIAAGPDGSLWFTEANANQIGRITTAGVITEFPVPTSNSFPFDIALGPDGSLWFTENGGNKIGRLRTGGVTPVALAVNPSGNGVLEPNELASIEPTWRNDGAVTIGLTGASSNFIGPGGPSYSNPDAAAVYGSLGVGAAAACIDCYSVQIASGARPVAHWDSTLDEIVVATPGGPQPAKTWTLHVGDSFADVPATDPYYPSIETIYHFGVTAGCATGAFCPSNDSLRQEMAPFLLKARFGAGYVPPACTGIFGDVPCPPTPAFPYSNYIEDLYNRGIAAGCAPGLYCPGQPVTRAQMAPLLLKTLEGLAYVPPSCAGIFTDVPCPATPLFPFSDWIEELANRGITAGCGTGLYCPDASIKRQEIAVFLKLTFGLVLYGP